MSERMGGPVIVTEQRWQDDAACKGMDPNIFYPENHDMRAVGDAKMVCAFCPVREACLQCAIDAGEPHGIWGGVSARTRRRREREARLGTGVVARQHGTRSMYTAGCVCDTCTAAHTAHMARNRAARHGILVAEVTALGMRGLDAIAIGERMDMTARAVNKILGSDESRQLRLSLLGMSA